jgi:phage shock protein A
MGPFKKKKSKEEVEWERKLRLRRTKDAVEKYSNKCENLRKKYLDQAVDAKRLGNEQLAKRFAMRIMALDNQLKRARGFLLMMNDMELSREQLGIWKDLASTFKDFAASYEDDSVSFEQMKAVSFDLEKAISNSQQLGDILDNVLDTMSDRMADFDNVSSKELENIMGTIDEMTVDKEKSSVNLKSTPEKSDAGDKAESELDKRIMDGIKDIENEKNEK